MNTTLNKIRKYNPSPSRWRRLLSSLNKTKADDEPLSLLTIFELNGFQDAFWCLRAVEGQGAAFDALTDAYSAARAAEKKRQEKRFISGKNWYRGEEKNT